MTAVQLTLDGSEVPHTAPPVRAKRPAPAAPADVPAPHYVEQLVGLDLGLSVLEQPAPDPVPCRYPGCGRMLRDLKSIRAGIGPVCERKRRDA